MRLGAANPIPGPVFQPKATTALPFTADLYDRTGAFKRTLGGAKIADPVLNHPMLKATQNGGYQPITLEVAAAQPFPNLIPDPGFEFSNSLADVQNSWMLANVGDWTLMTAPPDIRRGGRALMALRTALGPNDWSECTTNSDLPMVPGQVYTLSAWSKQNAGSVSSRLRIDFFKIDATLRSSTQLFSVTGLLPWTYYTLTFTCPADGVFARVVCAAGWWDGSSGSHNAVFYDDIRLAAGTDTADPVQLTDVIRLSEMGDNAGTILLTGTVETTPDELSPGSTHHYITVTPWVAELGDGYFDHAYTAVDPGGGRSWTGTTPTDVAQFVRDAVAMTAHCSVNPISCPNTGITAYYDFQSTNPLDAIHVAKQIAGANWWWFVDAEGVVWFQPVVVANPPTITLKRGVDFNSIKPSQTILGMKNLIAISGGGITSLYSNPATQARFGIKAMNPNPAYPQVTDQGTLDAIAASLGVQFDRVINGAQVELPALGLRLNLNRPGGLTVRLLDSAQEALSESGPGTGTYGSTLIVQDIETDGAMQRLVLGDSPFADTDTAYEATRIAQRISVVASAPGPTPVVVPPPPAQAPPSAVVVGSFKVTTLGILAMGGGLVTVGSAVFTTARAGTCQVQGSIDARMEAWDNYVAAPRRAVRMLLSGGIYTGTYQELPFGLTRATYDGSSASGLALAAGTYTVSWQVNTTEFNQIHLYSGWGRVLVTA